MFQNIFHSNPKFLIISLYRLIYFNSTNKISTKQINHCRFPNTSWFPPYSQLLCWWLLDVLLCLGSDRYFLCTVQTVLWKWPKLFIIFWNDQLPLLQYLLGHGLLVCIMIKVWCWLQIVCRIWFNCWYFHPWYTHNYYICYMPPFYADCIPNGGCNLNQLDCSGGNDDCAKVFLVIVLVIVILIILVGVFVGLLLMASVVISAFQRRLSILQRKHKAPYYEVVDLSKRAM